MDVVACSEKPISRDPLPPLDAKRLLPEPYFALGEDRKSLPVLSKDLLVESTMESPPVPALPPQPMVDKQGNPMTKRQIKEVK